MGELSQSCKRISLRIQLLFDDVQSLTDAEQEQIMEIIRVRLDEWQALKGLDYPTEKLSEQADPNPTPPKMAKLTTNLQGRKENVRSQKPTPSISPTKPHTITTVASPTKAPQTLTSVTPRTVDMHNNLVEMDSEPVDHNNQISNELDINSFARDTSNSQDTSTLIDAIKQEYEDDDNDETDDVNYDSNFTDISIKTESDINNSIDQVKEEQIEDDDCVPPESLKKPTGKSKRKSYKMSESDIEGVWPLSDSEQQNILETFETEPEEQQILLETLETEPQEQQIILETLETEPEEQQIISEEMTYAFKCCICGFKTNVSWKEQRHKHSHTNQYQCAFCGKRHGQKSDLDSHACLHTLRIKECSTCSKTYKTELGLQRHEAEHTGNYRHMCEYCGKGFSYINLFQDHQMIHTDQKLKCPKCPKEFASARNLREHKDICGKTVKDFKCSECGNVYKSKRYLKEHISLKHSLNPPVYVCHECGKTFRYRATLSKHMKSNHK